MSDTPQHFHVERLNHTLVPDTSVTQRRIHLKAIRASDPEPATTRYHGLPPYPYLQRHMVPIRPTVLEAVWGVFRGLLFIFAFSAVLLAGIAFLSALQF